jgi:hypothetical protein
MTQDNIINNDPELNGKFLGEITQDFIKVSDHIKEASYHIRKNGFSDYPIFPVSKSTLPIGRILYGRVEMNLVWNYYASYLDEFLQRKLIDNERIAAFKGTYKDPDEFCCLFLVDERMTGFIYIPYPVD